MDPDDDRTTTPEPPSNNGESNQPAGPGTPKVQSRATSPPLTMNPNRLHKLALFCTVDYTHRLRVKTICATDSRTNEYLSRNNKPRKFKIKNTQNISTVKKLKNCKNIDKSFDDITTNNYHKIRINRVPSKYGFQDITTKQTEVQKSFAHTYMKLLPPIPAVNFWLPLQKNIHVQDEKMPEFKPYFGDDETEKNEHFYNELTSLNEDDKREERRKERIIPVTERKLLIYKMLKKYPDLTVKEAFQVLIHINDSKDYDYEVEETSNMCDGDDSLSRTDKMLKRFFLVHSMEKWKNRAIAHGIELSRLQSEMESYTQSQTQNFIMKTSNLLSQNLNLPENSIENFSRNITSSKPPEMLLSTYHSLFCLICQKYDCLTHMLGPSSFTKFKHRVKKDILLKMSEKMDEGNCDNKCCLGMKSAKKFFENFENIVKKYEDGDLEISENRKKINNLAFAMELKDFLVKCIGNNDKENENPEVQENAIILSKDGLIQVMENWTESNISQYRNLKRIYQSNICDLSYLLNKSCQETFYFSILSELTDLQLNLTKLKNNGVSLPENYQTPVPKTPKLFPIEENASSSSQNTTPSHYSPKITKKIKPNLKYNKKQLEQLKKWMMNKRQINKDNRRVAYHPCDTCTSDSNHFCCETCPCFEAGNYCEDSCTCSKNCPNRFSGCNCRGRCESNLCPCYMGNRECDPDVCNCEMDFTKIDKTDEKVKVCRNNQIQRGLKVQIVMAPSCIEQSEKRRLNAQ